MLAGIYLWHMLVFEITSIMLHMSNSVTRNSLTVTQIKRPLIPTSIAYHYPKSAYTSSVLESLFERHPNFDRLSFRGSSRRPGSLCRRWKKYRHYVQSLLPYQHTKGQGHADTDARAATQTHALQHSLPRVAPELDLIIAPKRCWGPAQAQ